jgi:light-regulated signal transduction histidine kinase (bacteriophytochrome)
MITFHEQTHREVRHYQQASFEHQLVRYLAMVGGELRALASRGGNVGPERLEALVLEVESLSTLVLETHELTRRTPAHTTADLKKVVSTVLSQHRDEFEAKSTHLIKTFPHSAMVHGSEVEFLVLFQTLFTAVLTMLPKHKTMKLQLAQDGKRITLTITIPDYQLHQSLVGKPFNFATAERGIPTPYRLWRLQLAIAHQIAANHHGSIQLRSDGFEGTTYKLTLAAKDTEA